VNHTSTQRAALIGGPILALVVGASTSSVRDLVGATNVGIILAIIVTLAALVSRAAGLATAVTAAVTFNFFHTQPYHSLRITESRDVVIVALLAVLGLVVSDISAWRRRRDVMSARRDRAKEGPETTRSLLATTQPVNLVWPSVVGTIMDQLGLADCRLVTTVSPDQVLISRTASRPADGDDGFVLPAQGAAIPVVADGATLGFLLLTPRQGLGALWVERRVVIAFADHVAIALTYTGHRNGSDDHTKNTGVQ
jgi:K+-sensing histidine kinase KdpD